MTTYRAVAAATTAFAQRIKRSISPINGAIVTTERPSAPVVGGPPRVNLFLYHIDANPFLTTADLPTRRQDGSLMQKPRIALDLYYLLSFYGDDKLPSLEPQMLIGLTMSGIHAQPILTPEEYGPLGDAVAPGDYVALTPLPLSIHELSRLWTMFFQVPYTISVSLKASAAILVADLPAGEAPPVERRGLDVVLFAEPKIDAVGGPPEGKAPVVYGQELLVTGSGFGGEGVTVRVGSAELIPGVLGVTTERILLKLEGEGVRAGIQAVTVVNGAGFEALGFKTIVRPVVHGVSVNAQTIVVQVSPPVSPDQSVQLVLNRLDKPQPGEPADIALDVYPTALSEELTVSAAGAPPGQYALRVRVDGAESLLTLDLSSGHYDKPAITLAKSP